MPNAGTATLRLKVSDRAIHRYAVDLNVKQLRDMQNPCVCFRYHTSRARGSWYYIAGYGKGKTTPYRKIANWPDLSASGFLSALPKIAERLATEADSVVFDGFKTFGELLSWYCERNLRDRNKSVKRKEAISSAINRHLLPRLAEEQIAKMNQAGLDKKLIWPLQERYSLAYVRLIFGVLMGSLRLAERMKLIGENSLSRLSFTDFIETQITAKPAAIRSSQLREVLAHWARLNDDFPVSVALAVVMLAHGTRLGETRLAKWKNVLFEEKYWLIPGAETKTRKELLLPLTDQLCAFLRRHRVHQKATHYEGAFLFPARNGNCISLNQANYLLKPLGMGNWTSHDLRKVARTCWADLDVEHQVGEFLLNHQIPGISSTYIHTTLEKQKRAALERWHNWLDDQGFCQLTGNAPPASRNGCRP